MNAGRKWPSQPQPHQHRLGQHPAQPHRPGVLQPKAAAPQVRQTPSAPPVYHPQPTPKVLQRKVVTTNRPANQPARAPLVPPVYRPQPMPVVLQRKASVVQPPRTAPSHPTQETKPGGIVRPETTAFAAQVGKSPIYRPVSPPRFAPATPVQPKMQARPFAPPSAPQPVQVFSPSGAIQMAKTKLKTVKRPGFTSNAKQGAYMRHNLSHHNFKISNYSKPNLPSYNATMPHRMSWKDIRDNALKFYNGDETAADFKRWTLRFASAGTVKIERTEDKIETTKNLLTQSENDIIFIKSKLSKVTNKKLWKKLNSKLIKERENKRSLKNRKSLLESLLERQKTSQREFIKTRQRLVKKMESYEEARAEWKNNKTGLTKLEMKDALDEARSALTEFLKEANSFHANVPDLGPHRGVNNPVKEHVHLRFRKARTDDRGRKRSRSPSPMSERVLRMSPERLSEVATNEDGDVITVTGESIPTSDLKKRSRKRVKRIGTKEIGSYKENSQFGPKKTK